MDFIVVDDVVAVERGVDQRELAQGGGGGGGDKGQVGERETVVSLELAFESLPHLRHLGHIHAVDGGDVRGRALGEQHVLGDLDPHGAERLDFRFGPGGKGRRRRCGSGPGCNGRSRNRRGGGGRGGNRGTLRQVSFYILLGDAAAGSGAFDAAEVDIVLARHLAHQRRKRTGWFGGGLGGGVFRRRGFRVNRRGGSGGRRFRSLLGGGLLNGNYGLGRGRSAFFRDARHYRVDAYRRTFFHQHLGQRAGGGRRDFRIHFIG